MQTNLSFCEGKHLSPVTKKQIDEFVELQTKSVVLVQRLKGRLGALSKTLESYLKRR